MKCTEIIIKGSRKGQVCENENCKIHKTIKCPILIVKGTRKNQICNKYTYIDSDEYCKTHYFHEIRKPYNPYMSNEKDVIIDIDSHMAYSDLGQCKYEFNI